MIDVMRAKPGGAEIEVTQGDFATFALSRRFPVVFIAFNTIFQLPTQQAQLSCFASVARHLAPGGTFLVEAYVPQLAVSERQAVSVLRVDDVSLDLGARQVIDAIQRTYVQHYIRLGDNQVRLNFDCGREAPPSELDLMARLAGLTLHER
jgi:hypothetical protein